MADGMPMISEKVVGDYTCQVSLHSSTCFDWKMWIPAAMPTVLYLCSLACSSVFSCVSLGCIIESSYVCCRSGL